MVFQRGLLRQLKISRSIRAPLLKRKFPFLNSLKSYAPESGVLGIFLWQF